jgi:glycosyltransferase involved in cell wall biosynthesis
MHSQSLAPSEWVVVDNGSTDETAVVLAEIAASISWARSIYLPKDDEAPRGAPVVRAFHAGVDALQGGTDVVVKLDADVSFENDFFERIVRSFEADPRLGITGGVCLEQDANAEWRTTHVTRGHVRGATRAYRAGCLEDVLPLEERMGWDGIDELKARVYARATGDPDGVGVRRRRRATPASVSPPCRARVLETPAESPRDVRSDPRGAGPLVGPRRGASGLVTDGGASRR